MASIWIRRGESGKVDIVPVTLPIFPMASQDDMWTSADDRPESIASKAIQLLSLSRTGWPQPGTRQLIFVLTGGLRLESADIALAAGGMVVVDADIDLRETVSFDEDSRVLSLHVGNWEPRLADHAPASPSADAAAREPNFKWLYTGPDGQAYFRAFDELFDDSLGWGATVKPAYDTMLIEQADGFFMDWHPEGANNLVVVLTGELELEAAGGGQHFQSFRPGDICFAIDKTGQGHIDRARGATLLATIVIPTKAFVAPPHPAS